MKRTTTGTLLPVVMVLLGTLLMSAAGAVQAQPNPPDSDVPPPGPGGVGGADGTTTLELWLDANDLSLSDGAAVDTWTDASGNTRDVTQSGSKRPTYNTSTSGFNGRPVLDFDGTDDVLSSSKNLDLTSGYTLFIVGRNDAREDFNGLFRIAPAVSQNTSDLEIYWAEGSSNAGDFLSVSDRGGSRQDAKVSDAGPSPDTTPYLTTVKNTSSGSNLAQYIDGADETSSNPDEVRPLNANPFHVGVGYGGSTPAEERLDGDVAEVIAFSEEINRARRTIVNSYLANKYGISTGNAEVEPYAHSSNHFDDFAGLGQAGDGSNETDVQSGVLRLGSPTALDDGDFLFYGHDGANASSWTGNETPSTVDERLEREWRLDEIDGGPGDGVGTLTVEVDADDLPATGAGTNYFVLVDGDDDFTGGATRTQLTLEKDSLYNATGVSVSDGDYVTIAQGAVPSTPQNLAAESDLNQEAKLTWDKVDTDVTGSPTTLTGETYRIYQNTTDDFSGATKVDTSDTTGETVTGLTNGTQYYFWVTAVNDVGESEEQDDPASATPALKVFFSTANSGGDEPNGADDFDIELSDTHSSDVTVDLSVGGTAVLRSVDDVSSIDSVGSNYSEGDIIGEDDNTGDGSGMQIKVTSVNGSGEIGRAIVLNGGDGYTSAPTSFTTLSGSGSGADFTVTTQSAEADYTLNTATVTITSGNTSKTLGSSDLSINNESAPENTETVNLSMSNPSTSGATATLGGQTSHDVNVNDDDITRKVYLLDGDGTADDGNTSEEEQNTQTYTIETSSTDPVNQTPVDWRIDLNDSATDATADDFTSTSGTATIGIGASQTTFDLPIKDDATYELGEDVVVRLVGVKNAGLDDNPSSDDPANGRYTNLTHTIKTGDDPQPTVSFAASTSSVPDETTDPSIQVDLSPSSNEDIDVDLSTGGTATGGGTDYTLSSSTITIPAGQTSITLDGGDLSIVDDGLDENDETVELTLSNISSGTAGIDGNNDAHTLTVSDDDPKPSVAFDAGASTTVERSTSQNIGLSLSTQSGRDVTVSYNRGGTATGGTDYTDDDGGSVTISAGNTSKNITLSVLDDAEIETNEDVALSFGSGDLTNATTGGTTSHTLTIEDNDFGGKGPGGVGVASNNRLWLRSDQGLDTTGTDVNGWNDQSGNGRDVTAPTSTERPTLNTGTLNGRSVIDFNDNDGDVLTSSGTLDLTSGYTFFSVVEHDGSEGIGGVFRIADALGTSQSRAEIYRTSSGSDRFYTFGNRALSDDRHDYTANAGPGSGTSYLLTASLSSDTTDATRFIDGDEQAGGNNVSGTGTQVPSAATNFYVGTGYEGGTIADRLDGHIAETIVFNQELGATQRTLVHNYLSAKYGVALNTGGTATDVYAGDNGGNGDYDRAAFGIGQESSTDFHSAGGSDGLRFKAASGLDNGDYLMAGHRVADNSVNTSDVSGVTGLSARMDRNWFADPTNSGSTLTADLTFDLSKADLPPAVDPDPSKYVLLYRSGTSGNWTAVSGTGTASVANADQITFSGIDVTAQGNGYYTLGTTDRTTSPLSGRALTIAGNAGHTSIGTLGQDAGWYMVGPPVSGGKTDDLVSGPRPNQHIRFNLPSGNQLYEWNDTNASWDGLSKGNAFDNGRGHLLFLFDNANAPIDPTLTLDMAAGSIPDDNTDQTVSGLDQSADPGHVLANPYNVPFDLASLKDPSGNALDGTGDFSATVQIWDGGDSSGEDNAQAGSYLDVSVADPADMAPSGRVISPWQGFAVTRTNQGRSSGPTELTFKSGGTTTGTRSIVGSKGSDPPPRPAYAKIGLKMTVESENTQTARDEAASLVLHSNATADWDGFDAPKLAPLSGGPVFGPAGAVAGDSTAMKAVESRPMDFGDTLTVPVRTRGLEKADGTVQVQANEWIGVPSSWNVVLVDQKSGETTALTSASANAHTFKTTDSAKNKDGASGSSKQEAPALKGPSDGPVPIQALAEVPTPEDSSGAKAEGSSARFLLRIERPSTDGTTIALQGGLSASVSDRSVTLQWELKSESRPSSFVVQHQRLSLEDTTEAPSPGDWRRRTSLKASASKSSGEYSTRLKDLDYGRHLFRLRMADGKSSPQYTDPAEAQVRLGTAHEVGKTYPNPVPQNQRARLKLAVRDEQSVRVQVYDILGRHVRTAHRGPVPAQTEEVIEIATDRLSSGAYFLRIKGDNFLETRRMTVVH